MSEADKTCPISKRLIHDLLSAHFSHMVYDAECYDLKSLEWDKRTTLVLSTQENSIEFLVQSSLSYILLLMVCAHYCAPYPNDHVYDMRPAYIVHAV